MDPDQIRGLAQHIIADAEQILALTPPAAPVTQVLTAADLHYEGFFTLPLYSESPFVRLGWSTGALTGRRVNGELHLFITGAAPSHDPVYEVRYPGYGPGVDTAPRAPLVRAWGDVYQGRRLIQSTNAPITRGLHWAHDQLWWTYGDPYNVAGHHDPSVGTSVLEADGRVQAYGPWRTSEHSQKTLGYMVTIPPSFTPYTAGATFGIGGPITSGNASSPWGAMLLASALPSNDTPADAVSVVSRAVQQHRITRQEVSHISMDCQRLIYHDINCKQARDANFLYCDWHVPYDSSLGGQTSPGAPIFTSIDQISAAVWIDTPTKHGVLFFGQLATTIPGYAYGGGDTQTHMWYGPTVCPHGQNAAPAAESVGDAAGTVVPYLWIYAPEALAQAAQGAIDPWAVAPASVVPMQTLAPGWVKADVGYMFGGAYFDAETRLLFVSQLKVDWTNVYEPSPVVHVLTLT